MLFIFFSEGDFPFPFFRCLSLQKFMFRDLYNVSFVKDVLRMRLTDNSCNYAVIPTEKMGHNFTVGSPPFPL